MLDICNSYSFAQLVALVLVVGGFGGQRKEETLALEFNGPSRLFEEQSIGIREFSG